MNLDSCIDSCPENHVSVAADIQYQCQSGGGRILSERTGRLLMGM